MFVCVCLLHHSHSIIYMSLLQIGKKRKVAINTFKGRVLIDIREYYETGDGTEKPGKKGK